MSYQVEQLIEGKESPICVTKEETVSQALTIMIKNDYSQLPVVKQDGKTQHPEGMITYEGIIRGIRNFGASIDKLHVRDVMISAPIYSIEDDFFDILDRLKFTNAVLITEQDDLVGIVTSYDTAEYFRTRTEDLMWVEDIEQTIKEFIRIHHLNSHGELDNNKIDVTIARTLPYLLPENGYQGKKKTFNDLTLNEYIQILTAKSTWSVYEPIFHVQREHVIELMNGVRDIRNLLAHFRGDISAEQRDKLRFGAEWLARCQEEYQQQQLERQIIEVLQRNETPEEKFGVPVVVVSSDNENSVISDIKGSYSPVSSDQAVGKYTPLADWLQSLSGKKDQIQLTFQEIEKIIDGELPESARRHRAWWANDSVGHTHSQQWLDAGWRTTYINLSEGKVTFSRIREREKAYIGFFSKLLDELRIKANISMRDASPDGSNWITIQYLPHPGPSYAIFTYSFSRDQRFRVELYLDLGDKDQTKLAFDRLYAMKDVFESQTGSITWERLDNRRASRLAIYHPGTITNQKGHAELRQWAVETMIKFYNALEKPAEKIILEVKKG